jgi:hypothetical protein
MLGLLSLKIGLGFVLVPMIEGAVMSLHILSLIFC